MLKQKKGRFIPSDIKISAKLWSFPSNMVMLNIGSAFINVGHYHRTIHSDRWLPNETLAKLVGPMITFAAAAADRLYRR